jgi:hypothetical protein
MTVDAVHHPARSRWWAFAPLLLALLLTACQSAPVQPVSLVEVSMQGLPQPLPVKSVEALCVPPVGWQADPLKQSDRHAHQVWISPSGDTAYGVIRMKLPLPVGPSLVLWGFMDEMRRSEGQGTLLEKQHDREIGALRFVAEGGRYKVRTTLFVHGWRAWAIYAGTLRQRPENADELDLAVRAREATQIGLTPRRPSAHLIAGVQRASDQP